MHAGIHKPTSVDEVQAAVLDARRGGVSLEARGAGSKVLIGAPQPAFAVLDMGAMTGVLEYDPAELVLTARAGTSLAEIQKLLGGHDQMLAFEPMDHGLLLGGGIGRASLGGVIAANVAGPRRLSAGAGRDHLLGFEAVAGRGDIFRAGGKVVKNVTGYDLPKLLTGSWGTLAVLTEVTVKVLPQPRRQQTVVATDLGPEAATRVMSQAVGSPAAVTAAAFLPAGGAASAPGLNGLCASATLLRLEGVEPAIRGGLEVLRARVPALGLFETLGDALSARLWAWVRDVGAFAKDTRPVWRISTAPDAGWRVAAGVQARGGEAVLDWAGGLVWAALAEGEASYVRALVARHGGHATLVRGAAALRMATPVFPPQPAPLAALAKRVKAAFDPDSILGPRHQLAEAE